MERRIIGQQPSEAQRVAPGSVEVFSGWLHPGRRVQALNESSSNTETNNRVDREDVCTCGCVACLGANGERWMCRSKVARASYASTVTCLYYSECLETFFFFVMHVLALNQLGHTITCPRLEGRNISCQALPYLGPRRPRYLELCTWGRSVHVVT